MSPFINLTSFFNSHELYLLKYHLNICIQFLKYFSLIGTLLEFKGVLIGFYKWKNLYPSEDIGVVFWQNYTQTKIQLRRHQGFIRSAIVYNHN